MPIIAKAQRAAVLSNISTTETVFPLNSNSAAAAIVYAPGSDRFNGKAFRIRAAGVASTAVSTNLTIQLQCGTSLTVGSNTDIEASTARAVNSTTASWQIEAIVIPEPGRDVLGGKGWAVVNNLVDAEAALDNAATFNPNSEGVGFVVTATFSSGDAANTCTMNEFVVEEA